MTDNRKILEVVDGFNAFYLLHAPSGREACMGDGTGINFGFSEVGDEDFLEKWQDDVEVNYLEYFEAYFHDLYELEVYESLDDLRELFVVAGPPDPRWLQIGMPRTCGFTIYRYDDRLSAPMTAKVLDRWLENPRQYRLVAYTDLSFDEQAAIAEALEEYEDES